MAEYNQRTGDTAMEQEDQDEAEISKRRRNTIAPKDTKKQPRKKAAKENSASRKNVDRPSVSAEGEEPADDDLSDERCPEDKIEDQAATAITKATVIAADACGDTGDDLSNDTDPADGTDGPNGHADAVKTFSPSYALQTTGSLWTTFAVSSTVFKPLHAPARDRVEQLGQLSMTPDINANPKDVATNSLGQQLLGSTATHVRDVANDIDSYVREPEEDWDDGNDQNDPDDEPVVFEDENHQAPRMVPTFLASLGTDEVSNEDKSGRDARTPLIAGRLAPRHDQDDAKGSGSLRPRGRKARVRMPDTPKWSESAKNHMSNMLASSPADLSSTIPLQPSFVHDRSRVSGAAMLLGLPALMLVGFAAAYVYQAYNPEAQRAVLGSQQPSSSANILGLKATSDPDPAPVIVAKSQSTVAKQIEVKVADKAVSPLPPPVAPPLAPLDTLPQSVSAEAPTSTVQPDLTEADKALKPVDSNETVAVADAAPVIEPTASTPLKSTNILPEGLGLSLLSRKSTEPPVKAESRAQAPVLPEAPAEPVAAAKPAKTKAAGRMYAALDPSASKTATAAQTENAPSESDQLVKRGRLLLGMGDIVSARLILSLAVENGKSEAAGSLARTFDPVYFARLGVHGVKPDPKEARKWYRKAVKSGDDTALVDMQALKDWQAQNPSQ